MDELRIYNRVLSSPEIQSLSTGTPGQAPGRGLVVALAFDNDVVDTVGNTVAEHGAPTFIPGVSGAALSFDGAVDLRVSFVPVEYFEHDVHPGKGALCP